MGEERKYWIAFSAFPGIGPVRYKLLLDYFGSAQKAWEAKEQKLKEIGLGEKLVAAFLSFRKEFSLDDYTALIKKKNIWIVTWEDEEYPKRLKEIPDAPFLLYGRGSLRHCEERSDEAIPSVDAKFGRDRHARSSLAMTFSDVWNTPCVAVVGTRRMTSYGREATKRIVEGLVHAGVTIVSGMAYGVDTVAHETAVSRGGKTIAVLGCGVDVIHPRANTNLYWKIIKEAGCVISEFPVGQYAAKGLFPARNRIISGLSLGTIVIEGAKNSGSLITARYAAEQGRDVFAVPGPITSEMSGATNILLKQGAKLVTGAEDVLEELNIKNNPIPQYSTNTPIHEKMKNLSNEEKSIIELLQRENLHIDELIRRCNVPASKLATVLTIMEMKQWIKQLGGGVYGV